MEENKVLYDILNDRLELLRQLDQEGDSPRRRHVAAETSALHAKLAHKLGLYAIKTEMEDLALKFQDYDTYKYIARSLNEKKAQRDAYIASFIEPLEKKLKDAGYVFTIKGRPKSIHSIYHKMQAQKCDIDRIYDLFAIRIILDSPLETEKKDCWQVYSLITDMYTPNPKRLRDWLSVPKENGYESLHTTVMGPENKWVEVQIRTRRMDEVAEKGVAAHWAYKGVTGKLNIDANSVYVFTPTGDLRRLPAGATVLDFAYSIHSEVGSHCVGGKIRNQLVPIRHPLQNGDQIEILTSVNQHPTLDWLNFVAAPRTKNRIRQAIAKLEAPKEQEYVSAPVEETAEASRPHARPASVAPFVKKEEHSLELVVDINVKNVDYNMSHCCDPQPGDPIFGFISVTKGIRIHKMDCPNAQNMRERFPYRVIPARWAEKK